MYPVHVYPIYDILEPPSSKFQPILLYRQPFLRYRPLWDRCTESPKWPQTIIGQGIPYSFYRYPPAFYFNPFHSTATLFQVTVYFETSTPNDPKLTFNTMGSKIPTTWSTILHECKISLRLLYDQPFLSHRLFWHRCTEWPQNDLNTKRSKVHHIVHVTTTPSPKFLSVSLYD